ncbi:hypothetical protein THOM_2726 [Trachipleistophora hominis]|uniref:Uncharacterized protein n=1 Tax=Trachipleistophora hominis TaxID=72359 RepID=L7JSA5_TRAHO|nr:hypothetical protein THOM_2726 [Trachipleistophora hominis]
MLYESDTMNQRSSRPRSALSTPGEFVWCVRKCEVLIRRTFKQKKIFVRSIEVVILVSRPKITLKY